MGTGGQGVDLAGRIGTYGVQFNVGRLHPGARAAPCARSSTWPPLTGGQVGARAHWQCLTLEQNHPTFQRQLRDWFPKACPPMRLQLVTRSLISRGYLPACQRRGRAIHCHTAQNCAPHSHAFRPTTAWWSGVVDFPTYDGCCATSWGLARRHAGPHWLEHHQRRTSHRATPLEAVLPPVVATSSLMWGQPHRAQHRFANRKRDAGPPPLRWASRSSCRPPCRGRRICSATWPTPPALC